jgi:hypothetical protein
VDASSVPKRPSHPRDVSRALQSGARLAERLGLGGEELAPVVEHHGRIVRRRARRRCATATASRALVDQFDYRAIALDRVRDRRRATQTRDSRADDRHRGATVA